MTLGNNTARDRMHERVAFRCPECGCIKDAWDVPAGRLKQSAWCHAWPLHANTSRRRMRPVVVAIVDESAPWPGDAA